MTPSVCSKMLFHSIIYLISGTVWKRIYNGFKHSLKLGTATPRAAHHTNYFQLSPCAPPLPLGQSQASRREAQVCHATPVQWNALNKESRNATKAHLLEKRKTPFAWPDIVEAHLRVLHLAALLHLLLDLGRLPCPCLTVCIPLGLVMLCQMVGDCAGCWKKTFELWAAVA